MNVKRTIISVAVTMMFLVLALSPGISAQKPAGKQQRLSICMRGVAGMDYSIQIEITQEKLDELNTILNDCLEKINATIDESSPDGANISVFEWNEVKNSFYTMVDLIKTIVGETFQDESVKTFISSIIESLLGPLSIFRQPLISIGIGITWVPFYEYETYLGKLIRPVFMRHFIGFSATCRLNPFNHGLVYWNIGTQRVSTFLFNGLLINFGDLAINRLIGPQLLIGYGVFTGLIG